MPRIQIQAVIPASPEAVYEHVTAFAVNGRTGRRALEERYGRLVGRDGDTYKFQWDPKEETEDTEQGVTWHCTFQPPTWRLMQAPGSNWADRTDWFEPRGEETLWTIMWVGKAQGFRVFAQWLLFQFQGKRRAYAEVVLPVVRHFKEASRRQT